jgi:hypothetical protein
MWCFIAFVLFCSRLVCTGQDRLDLGGQPVSFREEWVHHGGLIVEQKETKNTPLRTASAKTVAGGWEFDAAAFTVQEPWK